VGVVCTSDAGCANGFICVGDICVASCANNVACPSGLVCGSLLGINNVCVGAQCGPNQPCAGGPLVSACLLGICVKI
jgi:hypothetical protein